MLVWVIVAFGLMPNVAYPGYVRGHFRKNGTYVRGYYRGGGGKGSSTSATSSLVAGDTEDVDDSPSSSKFFDAVKGALVIIKGQGGVGSGFVVEDAGRRWVYTNEHVSRIGHPLKAVFLDGREIPFGGTIEIAEDRDLARMEINEDVPFLKVREKDPSIDMHVFVCGNSAGGDVLTKIVGKVVGVGDDKVEVTAKFVSGNSGSALLDESGCVFGVATYATLRRDPADWTKIGTRFNEVRRFGYRLNDVVWQPLKWEDYAKSAQVLGALAAYRDFLLPVCFKDKELVTDYKAKDCEGARAVPKLKAALSRLVRQDGEYLKACADYDAIRAKQKSMYPGDIGYPKESNVDIRRKKFRRELLESIVERKKALKAAVDFLRSKKWPCKRLSDSGAEALAIFEYCCKAYEWLNQKNLSQVNWRVD